MSTESRLSQKTSTIAFVADNDSLINAIHALGPVFRQAKSALAVTYEDNEQGHTVATVTLPKDTTLAAAVSFSQQVRFGLRDAGIGFTESQDPRRNPGHGEIADVYTLGQP